jgi:TonB-dependent SusC/RagA subfamily outer membrane receptor
VLHPSVTRVLTISAALVLSSAVASGAQQRGQVSGTVVSETTGDPVGAVQVFIDGTTRGTITRADGTFTIGNLPTGAHTVVARSIGYQTYRQAAVPATPGATTPLQIRLRPAAVALQEVVVTGLIDPTEGVRSPITVTSVTRDQVPLPSLGQPLEMLQGIVPGLTVVRPTGQPGGELTALLRTPTSARGDNNPLIVVDGVLLGAGMVEIEPQNIQKIEVIKGAAASSLYGTRGASGVIAITTSRGTSLPAGQTRFSVNTEAGVGFSGISLPLPTHHAYLVNSGGEYVNLQGQVVPRAGRLERPEALGGAFMDRPYRDPLFSNLSNVYKPGNYNAQAVALDSNSETTNFSMSLTRYAEPGVIDGHEGYDRQSLRANIDHRFLSAFTLSLNAYHVRAERDLIDGGVTGSPLGSAMHDLLAMAPDVDIRGTGVDGLLLKNPDPTALIENPLWRQSVWETDQSRGRSIANGGLRWNPSAWFSASVELGFDREEHRQQRYVPKKTEESVIDPFLVDGTLVYRSYLKDAFNGSAQATARRDFGALGARTTLRTVAERDTYNMIQALAEDFNVAGVPRINPGQIQRGSGDIERVRSNGYMWDTGLDYAGKYIAQLMVRTEASSLFAPTGTVKVIERRIPGEEDPIYLEEVDLDPVYHNYYRAAFAYRIGEESWFNLPNVDELKLRYARGTAGGRPPAVAYSEAWFLDPTGITKRGVLGNRDLRPEHTTEQEFGLDLILFNRLGVELVHARQLTSDQIIDVPLTAATGYSRRWENVGSMAGSSTELRLETRVLQTPRLTWSTLLSADRSRSRIRDWDGACLQEGVTRICEGSSIRDIWTHRWARGVGNLPTSLQAQADQFQVNDDGYLVWVGQGNSYRDGISRNLWGTTGTVGGQTFGWGLPILEVDEGGNAAMRRTGSGDPDLQLGWINQFRLGGLSVNAQLHAAIGNDLVNLTRQHLVESDRLPEMDQAGRSDDVKKPMHYYRHLHADGRANDHFVEDASFLKLRSLSVTYRLSDQQMDQVRLGRVGGSGLEISLVGRNLLTLSGYSGLDPEFLGHDPELSTWSRLVPVDFYGYPPRRSLSAAVGITF